MSGIDYRAWVASDYYLRNVMGDLTLEVEDFVIDKGYNLTKDELQQYAKKILYEYHCPDLTYNWGLREWCIRYLTNWGLEMINPE